MKEEATTTWPELTTILLARLGALWLLVLVSFLFPPDDSAFHAFIGIAFITTIPYSLWLRSKVRSSQFAPLQFLVDLVLVSGLVYFTGGVRSELTLLYPLVILSAGIVSTPRQTVEITVLAIVAYVLMVAMLSQGMLPEYLPEGAQTNSLPLYTSVALRVFTFALSGIVGVYMSKRCNYRQHGQDPWVTAKNLMKDLDIGILLLNRQGRILDANPKACSLLQTTEQNLSTREFGQMFRPGNTPIPKQYGETTYLERGDDPAPLPVSFCSVNLLLPRNATEGRTDGEQKEIDATLILFSDLSRTMELERQTKRLNQISAATRVAGEMAYEIRTPLTTISASVQLLKRYEEKTTAADWLPNSPRRKDRAELFAHISSASDQMDSVIRNFSSFAEILPSDLLSIIKLDSNPENQGYIPLLNTREKGLENGENPDSRRRPDNPQLAEQDID